MTYVVTRAGKRLNLLDPDPSLIELEDIAHRLHEIKRYAGMSCGGWTVAQHTTLVAMLVEPVMPEAVPWALMHDAHEGFIGDWITPVKQALSFQARERANFDAARGLQSLETRIARAIHQSAGILFPLPPMVAEAVKDADEQAYVTEVKHLIPRHQAKEFNTDGMPPAVDREILSHIAKLNAVDTLMKMFAKHFASIDRARSMQLVEAPIQ